MPVSAMILWAILRWAVAHDRGQRALPALCATFEERSLRFGRIVKGRKPGEWLCLFPRVKGKDSGSLICISKGVEPTRDGGLNGKIEGVEA